MGGINQTNCVVLISEKNVLTFIEPEQGFVWYYNVEDDIIKSATLGSNINTWDAAETVISEAGLVGLTAYWIKIVSNITKENIIGRIDPM